MPSVVTANHLRTGSVVYLADDGRWVANLDAATPSRSADDLARLERIARAAVERNDVTAVYAFDVRLDEQGRPTPVSVRERIRSANASAL